MEDETANDAEIARALAERFRAEEEADRAAAERAAAERLAAEQRLAAERAAAEAFGTSAVIYDDAEAAHRREQEARDAEFAQRLAEHDRDVGTASAARGIVGGPDEAELRRRSKRRSMTSGLACLIAVAIAVLIFWLMRRSPGNPISGISFDPADWFGGGDWESGYTNAGTKGRNNAWYSSTKSFDGLDLRVLNNLDEQWQDMFATVMVEWDQGEPDAVSFRIERISDPACRAVIGAMVVCNGDYGQTSWRGINELAISNGYIVSSVAKLNDRYLSGADEATRQYVCCHEVGHGLGLGHTDEAMYNADLGECMDYTVRPKNNMRPGKANFELLERMYGNVDGTSDREELQEEGFIRGRERRGISLDDLGSSLDGNDINVEWSLVHKSPRAEHYERDLGRGIMMRRVLLLV